MKEEKKNFTQVANKFKVKEIIKKAKTKGIVRPHTEAFDKVSVNNEKHRSNADYFLN